MWVPSLGWEDWLEKEMATHSNILVWEIPWTEEPGGLQSMGSQRVGYSLMTKTTTTKEVHFEVLGATSQSSSPEGILEHRNHVTFPNSLTSVSCI